jgi:hypothetical protein
MQKKSVYLGVSGIPIATADALREQARLNNRSVSGEVRAIIEAQLFGTSVVLDAPSKTEKTKTTWTH